MVKLSDNARNATDRTKLLFVCKASLAASEGKEQPMYMVKARALSNYFNLVNNPDFDFNRDYAKTLLCNNITAEERRILVEDIQKSYVHGEDKVSDDDERRLLSIL